MITLATLKTGQIASLFGTMTILQLNEENKLVLLKGEPIRRGSFPAEVSDMEVKLVGKEKLQTAINEVNHKDDWFSLMNAELIRKNYL